MGAAPSFGPVPLGIYFGDPDQAVPDPFFDGRGPARQGCTQCGACLAGCVPGAKNTLDLNYLHLAERRGAVILPERKVTKHHSNLCAGIFGKDSFDHVGYEGMFIFKASGRYYLCCAENFEGRYSCTVATATNLYGPYGERYEALPHAGHNMFFRDDRGQWWSTYFGSDGQAPWQERPGVFPVEFDAAGRIRFQRP